MEVGEWERVPPRGQRLRKALLMLACAMLAVSSIAWTTMLFWNRADFVMPADTARGVLELPHDPDDRRAAIQSLLRAARDNIDALKTAAADATDPAGAHQARSALIHLRARIDR